MAEKEQVRPLAPAASRIFIDEKEFSSAELKRQHHRKYVQCCGCIAALMLITAVIILVLIFTVFRIKDPMLRMNSFDINGLDPTNLSNRTNLTVTADVSVKNPNVAAFRFNNATTTTIYYDGVVVGEGRNPPGLAKARRTLRLNVTIDMMVGRLLGVDRLRSDLSLGELNMSSYTKVSGRVKILGIIKKRVLVKMNCTMTVNVLNQDIQDQNCRRSVSI